MKWNLINSNKFGDLEVECYKSDSAKLVQSFDLAIIFNSYDARALEYIDVIKDSEVRNALLINFQSDSTEKHTNYQNNVKFLKDKVGDNIYIIDNIDIFNYENNLEAILAKIPRNCINLQAKWFIDITGIPGIYFMPLIKIFKSIFPSPHLTILNISGIYKNKKESGHKYFSDGIIRNLRIPRYEGKPNFSKPSTFIFLLGFEGERSLSILKSSEPMDSKIIIADPGYSAEYVKDAIDYNRCFLQELSTDIEQVIRADVGDPLAVYAAIDNIYKSIKGEMNLCLIPLGPKAHILGASLYGIQNPEISIMSQLPRKYYLKEIPRGEYMWLYIIK